MCLLSILFRWNPLVCSTKTADSCHWALKLQPLYFVRLSLFQSSLLSFVLWILLLFGLLRHCQIVIVGMVWILLLFLYSVFSFFCRFRFVLHLVFLWPQMKRSESLVKTADFAHVLCLLAYICICMYVMCRDVCMYVRMCMCCLSGR